MNRNGGQLRQVTHNGQFNGDPSFSPDGSRLVFRAQPEGGVLSNIYSIRLDGTGLRKLTHLTRETFASEPEYSPDGQWIAFMKFPPGGSKSPFLIRANGGDLHRVTRQWIDAGHPSWSPDGARIIFNDKFTQPVGDIFTIRPTGAGLTRLTFVQGRGLAASGPTIRLTGRRSCSTTSAAMDPYRSGWCARTVGETPCQRPLPQYCPCTALGAARHRLTLTVGASPNDRRCCTPFAT